MKQSHLLKPGLAARALLVDDNRDGVMARKSLLEEQGFVITTATNGEEGIEALSKSEFDLMVTDFKMPKMNGIELIRRARALHPKLPIILLSGFVESLGFDERSSGADVVIAKGKNEVSYLLRASARLLARKVAKRPPASQTDARSKPKTNSQSV
jgi:CheY-like chemotaxis protein